MLRAIVALVIAAVLAPDARAAKRVALVVGNSTYQHTGRLANPKNDASDVAAALRKLGFHVLDAFDLDKPAFDRKVRDFAAALQGAEAGLFFFAGHGLQVAGHNYLVPVDAELQTASALDFEMVRLDVVQRVMEHETNTNILFLDACRDNPLARNLARALGTRSVEIGRGFAPVVSGVGTLISFSTQPGNVAIDGKGRNSPFAGALTKHLAAPKDDLSAILIDVRNDVMRETQNKQVPWEHSALRGRFYFGAAPLPTPPPPPPVSARLNEAAEAWDRTKGTQSIAALEAFILRFGDTYYGDLAKMRLSELKQAEATKQAADAAKKRAEEDAGAKAEAERQRLALQKQQEQKRAETKRKAEEEATRRDPALSVNPGSGQSFRDCPDCPEMVVVPAGSFMMGYSKDELRPPRVTGNQVPVTITRPFAIGRFAVMRGEFAAFVRATGHNTDGGCKAFVGTGSDERLFPDRNWGSPGFSQDDRHPVVCVNWSDARAYVAWLSMRAGKSYRLPSEAEREYVSRAGTTTPFWWGSSISPRQANYDGNFSYAGGPKGEHRGKSVPVDSFDPNPWGLYNVHGNVWELVDACQKLDLPGLNQCSRVVRGGSWNSNPRLLVHASSFGRSDGERFNNDGFRLARTLD